MVSKPIDRIKKILAEEFDVCLAIGEMDAATLLFEGGLDLDSFAIVGVIARVEEEFEFEFSSEELQAPHFRSVGTLSQMVADKVGGAAELRPS